jgi:hypothetical protein
LTRIKKTVDYIEELCSSNIAEKRLLGSQLKTKYEEWTKTLSLKDFSYFNEVIKKNKNAIGSAQFFGKFRAYAFEEYIYRLLQTKVRIPKPLQVFWGEECLVWRNDGKEYAMEFDVSVGKKTKSFVEPVVVLDSKIELDSARLKTALASFIILKHWNPAAKCFLVYMVKEVNSTLLELMDCWINGTFQLSLKNDETTLLLNCIAECLSSF